MASVALVAVTEQLPAPPVAVSLLPLMLQFMPPDAVAAKVTAPVPEPPVVLRTLPLPLVIVVGLAVTVKTA